MTALGILSAARVATGLGRRWLRGWYEWAAVHPDAARLQLLSWANLAHHRVAVLKQRRVVWRKGHRVHRLRSAARELRLFAAEIHQRGVCPRLT